ncbi:MULTISPECIES: YpdA family putative bacillithiol disulfide reductase [Mammaliicoccus]|jgi:putative YpdA family bacillithiol system oxidoreductase|uniref:YpdA family putative bacillithiol disulfide reductase n=1 Tax=Mammaliicoccus sciuri TaxID=1296 RepID=A0AAW5LM17_MAMSC|nr:MULTISPECIES: YpdA family putative bacillithiol disulfide reductase [Mammaliicoccus]MBO1208486.1 YpdA family putative bacillithiol disulfide reductase [Mammaliicoccus sciuri]MCD5141327.1 YpdA family putative bacillithiol disulfide reductase [Mammaliicoccus sciuri]MCD8880804.1 YpdA family putative bacillithiol disulfide reductase [Mammaliicoccus sciuri]MCJ0934352.1 YpdA family putative bacillithiol disulfide reductase [Mammaliicoccus sciuri]MCP1286973.1 YpdA family putative bacillithiol disu
MQEYESLIIGGGPCGLSAAIEQKRKGINAVVIEKGNVVDAIYHYPTHQTFFSSSDKLGIGDVPFIVEDLKPKRNQALVYYREVVKHHQLDVRTFEEVLAVKKVDNRFLVSTTKQTYKVRFLTIATGYYGQPNELEVEGQELSKVMHYFKEAHPYFNQDVVIIGGKNSAVDAAIELEKAGANVTVLYRGSEYSKSIKPWILPNFDSLAKHEKITMHFNSEVERIDEDTLTFNKEGKSYTIKNDFVFAMIGYHPDYKFLESCGVETITNEFGTAPSYNKDTMESNVENLYIAGVIAAGNDANTIFIENGKFHGGTIAQDIERKKQTPLES